MEETPRVSSTSVGPTLSEREGDVRKPSEEKKSIPLTDVIGLEIRKAKSLKKIVFDLNRSFVPYFLTAGVVLVGTAAALALSNPVAWGLLGFGVLLIGLALGGVYAERRRELPLQAASLFEIMEKNRPVFENRQAINNEVVRVKVKEYSQQNIKKKEITEKLQKDTEKLRKEATNLLKKKQYEAAAVHFAQLIEKDDSLIGTSPVWFDFCRAVYKQGQFEEALELLRLGSLIDKEDKKKQANYLRDGAPLVDEIIKKKIR